MDDLVSAADNDIPRKPAAQVFDAHISCYTYHTILFVLHIHLELWQQRKFVPHSSMRKRDEGFNFVIDLA